MALLDSLFPTRSEVQAVRYAVVGLGHFAQSAILPAFANAAENSKLTALVTGDVKKAEKLSRKYDAPAWNYEAYGDLLRSGAVDAVYVATPNSEHRLYAEQAAAEGIHVLCEKPLAYSVADARAMVTACHRAEVYLMTAYRLHFEAGNLSTIEAIRSGKIGEPRLFTSTHTMQVDPENIRLDLELGGGPLEDIGVYCLNAARYVFRDEPEVVSAFAVHGHDRRFKEVPESVAVTMRFSGDRLATFLCGFGAMKNSEYRVIGTEGMITTDPAFTWQGEIKQTITRHNKSKQKTFAHRDQIAAEIIYFSDCILKQKSPEPSGLEGLIDVRIIDAIRRSYAKGRPVRLARLTKNRRPYAAQAIKKRPHGKPRTVRVKAPAKQS